MNTTTKTNTMTNMMTMRSKNMSIHSDRKELGTSTLKHFIMNNSDMLSLGMVVMIIIMVLIHFS